MTDRQIRQIGESIGLEQAIDKHGLYWVLASIREICFGNAEHLETNWQDKHAGKKWEHAGYAVDDALDRINKLAIPGNPNP